MAPRKSQYRLPSTPSYQFKPSCGAAEWKTRQTGRQDQEDETRAGVSRLLQQIGISKLLPTPIQKFGIKVVR